MPRFGDEDPFGAPVRPSPTQHEIGQPIDTLSLVELTERIEILRVEIERLETVRSAKEASKRAADAFFKS
jgi:uncharacterized small protein (DUF1192 family)